MFCFCKKNTNFVDPKAAMGMSIVFHTRYAFSPYYLLPISENWAVKNIFLGKQLKWQRWHGMLSMVVKLWESQTPIFKYDPHFLQLHYLSRRQFNQYFIKCGLFLVKLLKNGEPKYYM